MTLGGDATAMAQTFWVGGLLLVPLGFSWLAYELRKRARGKMNFRQKRGGTFALASMVAASIAYRRFLSAFMGLQCFFGLLTLVRVSACKT